MKKRIAITMGDPCGIGPEIIAKALLALSDTERGHLVIFGSLRVLKKAAGDRLKNKIDIIDIDNLDTRRFSFGQESKISGQASLDYLKVALEAVKAKEVFGLVTCPVSKYAINLVEKGFRGQTEYLAHFDKAKEVRMMLLASRLKFILVTTHMSLREACQKLTGKIITRTIIVSALELRRLFGLKKCAIGVCGLNPHLGEAGLLGREEADIIEPAIKRAKLQLPGCIILGPAASEKIVFNLQKGILDAAVCLYHDQAMVPLKILYPFRGVNLSLGLSFVRTSPLHGTAFDIAGKGKANALSLLDAIRLALQLTRNKLE